MSTPEPAASAVLEILNGFVLHADLGADGPVIRLTCSWRDQVPPGVARRSKCTWHEQWGAQVVGVPIRLVMDTAVEHLAKEHGA